jgi:outer membrane protein assembly factor BamA
MRQRPGYVENHIGADFTFALSPDIGLRVGFRREGVRPDSSGFGRFLQSRTWALEGGLEYDRRDNRWNPRSGLLYRGRFTGGRVLREGNGQGRWQYALDLMHFLPLGKRSLLAVGLHSAGVREGDRAPAEARLRLGGTTTIRGHREEAFLATQAAWAKLEWRKLLGRRSRAFLFFDLGYLDDPEAGEGSRYLFPVGYGAGLRASSRMGMIGLDYGLTKGDSPGQGKVHVRMVNEF